MDRGGRNSGAEVTTTVLLQACRFGAEVAIIAVLQALKNEAYTQAYNSSNWPDSDLVTSRDFGA